MPIAQSKSIIRKISIFGALYALLRLHQNKRKLVQER